MWKIRKGQAIKVFGGVRRTAKESEMKINIKRFVTLVTVIIIISFSIIPAKQPVEETAVNYKAQPIKPKILAF